MQEVAVQISSHSTLVTVALAMGIGTLLMVLCRYFNMPAIVILLLTGVACGPEILGIIRPETLGDTLNVFVSLAVGLILFEGGLTLDLQGYRNAPGMIKRLLTTGVIITWLGTAFAIWLIFHFSFLFCLLGGSLVIVTGPTVIGPLLKKIRLDEKLHNILHWESVLIDPVGVFIALFCFEIAFHGYGGMAFANLLGRLLSGACMGIAGGFILSSAVHRCLIPPMQLNAFILGMAVSIFAVAECVKTESGILAVTISGFALGLRKIPELKQIRQFKAEIADILIGTLFMLLASRLRIEQFIDFGFGGLLMTATVILLIRPLNILVCSKGQNLNWKEKLFLSWTAPRGIVAASMASLFAMSLQAQKWNDEALFIETFTYSVIVATVLFQGGTAGILASILDLRRKNPMGWLIVGAHSFGRGIAAFIRDSAKRKVVLMDTNRKNIQSAVAEGFTVLEADARDIATNENNPAIQGVGNLLALTDNEDLNERLCALWSDVFEKKNLFKWSSYPATRESYGISVFQTLPKPSLISSEIIMDEAHMETRLSDGRFDFAGASEFCLAVSGKSSFAIDPASSQNARNSSYQSSIWLVREADYFLRGLGEGLIFDVGGRPSKEDLIKAASEKIISSHPELNAKLLFTSLMERETEFTTDMGNGTAIPHVYCREIKRPINAVARIREGVIFSTSDATPVKLAFFIISPHGDPESHLATIAEIAKIASDEEIFRRIICAQSPGEIISILEEKAKGLDKP